MSMHWFGCKARGGGRMPTPTPPPDTSGLYPNEPAGFTRVCEHDFSVEPGVPGGGTLTYGDTSSGPAGEWWQSGGSTVNLATATDGTEPVGGSHLQVTFPAGTQDGQSPCFFLGWKAISPNGNNPQTELYVSWWMRVWGDGTDYENQSTGTKLFYIPYMNTSRLNHSTFIMTSNPGSPAGTPNFRTSWRLTYYAARAIATTGEDPGGGAIPHGQNVVTSNVLQLGQWHHCETYVKQNTLTNPPTSDGIYRLWVDGVLVSNYTNMRYCSSLNPLGFYQNRWDMVWGGEAGEIKAQTDRFDFDHVYVSGKEG